MKQTKAQEVTTEVELTIEKVSERVELIQQIVQEEHPVVASEKAHVEQDKLFKDVLEAIAKGSENPTGLAEATLAVLNIEFTRVYR
ncbi:MAG: Waukesha92 13 [Bacillales bacterium]|jgi:predicted GTPase|nr:Waukesha92 13 [Bacillales bacterium]